MWRPATGAWKPASQLIAACDSVACMMRSGWVFLSAALVTVSGAIAQQRSTPETLRYSVMSNSVKSGAEVDTFRADGGIDSEFDFNDRGRGPKVEAHWVVDQNGMPVRVDVAGVDYLKAPVDEHFSVENGEAHWKSTSENGSAPAGRFYSGVNTPQVETALLVRLLARRAQRECLCTHRAWHTSRRCRRQRCGGPAARRCT
jgi:hypothetical protein